MRRPFALLLVAAAAGLVACGSPEAGGGAADSPDGTLFVLDRREDRVLVVDAAGGRIEVVRPRGLAKCGARMHVVGGQLVYVGFTRRASYAYALDPARPGAPRRLGTAHEVIPSRTPGRVWLAKIPRCRNVWRLRNLHEITVGGTITRRVRARVPGISLVAALDRGLLLAARSGGLVAWSPESKRILWRERRSFALAAGGELVAWCRPHGCRAIRITDLKSGRERLVSPPPGWSFRQAFTGALSPGGSVLAVPATDRSEVPRMALIDTRSGQVTPVKGSRLDQTFAAPAWSPGGWLYWGAGKGRLMAHRPGLDGAVALPLKLRHAVLGLAAGR